MKHYFGKDHFGKDKYCQNSECSKRYETFPTGKMIRWENYVFCSNECMKDFISRFNKNSDEMR